MVSLGAVHCLLLQGDDMGIPSDTDEDNQEVEVQADSGFGNVLGA